jgi:hypothetical protein
MDNQDKRNDPQQNQPPGSMSSYNNHRNNREGSVEEVKEHKDVDEGYMDYNGNSEANAPARAREGEEE